METKTTTSERLQSLDPGDLARFEHWCDWTGRDWRTGEALLGEALDEWYEADCGEYASLGEYFREKLEELDLDLSDVLSKRDAADCFDYDTYARRHFGLYFTELDGHVYADI